MSWYARTGPRERARGKFQSELRLGTEKTDGGQYRGWRYSFIAHQASGATRRTQYAVSIRDANNNRAAYLRGCSSIQQAAEAAKHWIDNAMGKSPSSREQVNLGAIPPLPTPLTRASQEK